jgi:hypothetical protein
VDSNATVKTFTSHPYIIAVPKNDDLWGKNVKTSEVVAKGASLRFCAFPPHSFSPSSCNKLA